ncbi:phosphatidylethanolamine n [Nannochloropsis gaditana]|uniref:Phosphatidylethanolamine n n=1 Tax=Nannochloropsis gaditana TaxID=72520 RepID=W7TC73_9STRA|nr:phosphatidylethanolamine n [Nannochloropsis gaditana]
MPHGHISLQPFGLCAAAAFAVTTTQGFVPPITPATSHAGSCVCFSAPSPSVSIAPTPPTNPAEASPIDAHELRGVLKDALYRSLGNEATTSSRAENYDAMEHVLACPLTLKPLRRVVRLAGPFGQVVNMVTTRGNKYPANEVYMDLVPAEERMQVPFFSPSAIVTQELFRSPLTSFLYERGWRDNFKTAGFPGIDEEFRDLEAFFAPLSDAGSESEREGEQQRRSGRGTVIDLSCGSGLTARRLCRSRKWKRVIAADFSESMLRETRRRFLEEKLPVPELVRADASRQPFQTSSVDAIHAGAALHCWPRLEESLRECLRVLKPGGRMYASTFEVNERLQSNTFRFFQLDELRRLFVSSGFVEVEVRREGVACLIVKAVKAMDSGGRQ